MDSGDFKERLHLQGLHRLKPLPLPPSGFVFSPSGGSLEICAFLEWNISPETQVSPRARSINVSESERARQVSPCGLGPLASKASVFKTAATPVEILVSLRARPFLVTSLRKLTCRPEQVLTTPGERQSQRGEPFL